MSLSDVGEYRIAVNKEQSQCVCEAQSASFTWNVSASKPGILEHFDVLFVSDYLPCMLLVIRLNT